MNKPHTGNHGLHKIRFWRKRVFESGGVFYLLFALMIALLIVSIVWGALRAN